VSNACSNLHSSATGQLLVPRAITSTTHHHAFSIVSTSIIRDAPAA